MIVFLRRLTALALLLAPPWAAVQAAIFFADHVSPALQQALDPILNRLNAWPSLPAALLAGDYGVVAMLPFLFLYALPTAVAFGVLSEAYGRSRLLDWCGAHLHPWSTRLGLGGKDLVWVMMGFGCNVPAVHATKACHSCTKEACVSAIAFGSACSYQHPATLAVLAAAGRADLAAPYLLLLAGSTAIFLRAVYGGKGNAARDLAPPASPLHLVWPPLGGLLLEVLRRAREFVVDVATVFLGVCLLAALAAWAGLLGLLDRLLGPLMALLNLPAQVGEAVVLSAVRKNGMAAVLVDPAGGLKVDLPSASQLLAAVFLAGVLLPCAVTVLAIGKELGWRRVGPLLGRQALAAAAITALVSWGGAWLGL